MAPRILIAENDSGAREQLAGWLEVAGFACSRTDTGDALAEARRHPPDVAVVGVAVPNDGGMWIVRSLRTQPSPVGVVVMSSEPSMDVATAATRLGAVDCLPWPSSERSFVDAVRRAAEWRKALATANQYDHRLREEVELGRQYLKATIDGVPSEIAQSVLLAVLESRSPDTYDHVRRVAQSSAALARSMKLAPIQIRDVRTAALLHDVGKIAIPHRLLGSITPLTDDEIAVVKMHVTIGADALATISTLRHVARIVAATHERYDGAGYPNGVRGENIPLGARLIAVADAYDAMTAGRSYTESMSHDDATAELVRTSGAQLDPDVVRGWIEMVENVRCS